MATAQVSYLQVGEPIPAALLFWLQVGLEEVGPGPTAFIHWLQVGISEVAPGPTAFVHWLQIEGVPAPSVPDPVASVEGAATSGEDATITWVGSSTETGFQVEIRTPPGSGIWAAATGGANPTAAGVQSFNATALTPATMYEPSVLALNDQGMSARTVGLPFGTDNVFGGEVPLTDTQDPVLPGTIVITSKSSTGYIATCGEATDNVGIDKYQYRVGGAGVWNDIPTLGRSFTRTGATAGSTELVEMRALDPEGNISNVASLSVTLFTPVSVVTNPASGTHADGASVTLTAVFAGDPAPSVQWYKNGVPVSGEVAASITFTASLADSGASYTCSATNAVNTVTTAAAVITVVTAVTISQQPTPQTETEGQSASFMVAATSAFPITYQWQLDGVNISGAISPSLVLSDLLESQSGGMYRVAVTAAGVTVFSNEVMLTVLTASTPAVITQEPSNVLVNDGFPASFSVLVSGTAPIQYQWREDGENIPGATSSVYTIPETDYSMNGRYYSVRVQNEFGVDISVQALLTVIQSDQSGIPYSLTLSDWAPGRVITPSRARFTASVLPTGSDDYFAFDFSSRLQFDYLVSATVTLRRYPAPLEGEAPLAFPGTVHNSFAVALVSGEGISGSFTLTAEAVTQGGRTLILKSYILVA